MTVGVGRARGRPQGPAVCCGWGSAPPLPTPSVPRPQLPCPVWIRTWAEQQNQGPQAWFQVWRTNLVPKTRVCSQGFPSLSSSLGPAVETSVGRRMQTAWRWCRPKAALKQGLKSGLKQGCRTLGKPRGGEGCTGLSCSLSRTSQHL